MRVIIINTEIAEDVSAPIMGADGAQHQLVPFLLTDERMALSAEVLSMPVYSCYFSILEKCEIIEVTDETY